MKLWTIYYVTEGKVLPVAVVEAANLNEVWRIAQNGIKGTHKFNDTDNWIYGKRVKILFPNSPSIHHLGFDKCTEGDRSARSMMFGDIIQEGPYYENVDWYVVDTIGFSKVDKYKFEKAVHNQHEKHPDNPIVFYFEIPEEIKITEEEV